MRLVFRCPRKWAPVDTFVAIDTETTGLSFSDDRVIEFGASIFIRGRCVHKSGWYIQTDVPNTGFHINGITDEQISQGYEPSWSFLMIASLIMKKPSCVVAYNAPFDLMMLANEFRRHGIFYDFSRVHIIDPLVVFRRYHPYQPARLTNACDRYRIPYSDAHTAVADSEAAGHVWCAMRKWHGLSRATIQDLEERQKRWHSEWARGFTNWAAAHDAEVSITPWPYEQEFECSRASEQLSLESFSSAASSSLSTSSPLSW